MTFVNIGLGNSVPYERISVITAPDSAPVKRIVQTAKEKDLCIDATYGRRTRSVIILDNNQVVLSSLQPETIVNRTVKKSPKADPIEDIS